MKNNSAFNVVRTHNPWFVSPALYQLSYGGNLLHNGKQNCFQNIFAIMLPICVRIERVWPKLPSIQGIRANLVYIVSLHTTLYYAHQTPNGQMQRKEITLVLLAHCCSALWYIVLLSLKVSLTSKAHIVLDHNRGGQVYREELKLSVEKLLISQ